MCCFTLYRETLTAKVLLTFLTRLGKERDNKVFLFLDNLRVHHAKLVRAWLDENKEATEVFYLPAYAPELNPDEYLNGDLKQHIRSGPAAGSRGELESRVRSVLKRQQCGLSVSVRISATLISLMWRNWGIKLPD